MKYDGCQSTGGTARFSIGVMLFRGERSKLKAHVLPLRGISQWLFDEWCSPDNRQSGTGNCGVWEYGQNLGVK